MKCVIAGFGLGTVLLTAFGGSRKARRRIANVCWPVVDDLLRVSLAVIILKPAASVLRRRNALAIARWCGSVMLRVPTSGRSVLGTMRKAFGMEEADARRNATESLAQPFYAFVVFQRVLRGREHPASWIVEERNKEDVVKLRESGRSFMIVTGHFARESVLSIYLPQVCPGSIEHVTITVPKPSLRPRNIRERTYFGQISRGLRHSFPDVKFVYVGDGARKLIKHLSQPGRQVVMAVDSFWHASGSSAHTRPFAGMKDRSFSTGAAIVSRLAQCPVASLASYIARDGTIILEWGPVIEPPQRNDESADLQNTNAVLDFLETAVGRRPTQYVLYLGEQRQWNPVLERWQDSDTARIDPCVKTSNIGFDNLKMSKAVGLLSVHNEAGSAGQSAIESNKMLMERRNA
jgi:lauroyl/myristoyl acyltransferase